MAERLAAGARAVVLERVARAAGQTHWYYVTCEADFRRLADVLLPGSSVSFYLDDRIRLGRFGQAMRDALLEHIARDGDAVIGRLTDDGLTIDVETGLGEEAIEEFAQEHVDADELFFGPYPGRDNDGVRAITLVLPDGDGIVRRHPY